MIPTDYMDTHNLFFDGRETAGDDPGLSVCPGCGRISIMLGEDERLFCRECGYRESEARNTI